MSSEHLDHAPFPPMVWDDYDWWSGAIDLAFGAMADLTVTPYDPGTSRLPSGAQGSALTFQLEHGQEVIDSVLQALLKYYIAQRPQGLEFLGSDADRLMPEVETAEDLLPLIDLRQVYIHPWEREGIAYVGLGFGCTWDREHGFGVQVHQARVAEIGSADTAFAWEPEELAQ
jgi:hypothetical protein